MTKTSIRKTLATGVLVLTLGTGVAVVAAPAADATAHRPAATNGRVYCLQADMRWIPKDVGDRLIADGWKGRTVGGQSDGAERLYSPACPADLSPTGIPGSAIH